MAGECNGDGGRKRRTLGSGAKEQRRTRTNERTNCESACSDCSDGERRPMGQGSRLGQVLR